MQVADIVVCNGVVESVGLLLQFCLGNNMFAYCGNNPVTRSDAEGDWWHVAAGAVVGATVAFVSSVATGFIESGSVDLGAACISAGFGALSGALAATGCSTFVQMAGGALLSGAESIASQAYENEGFKNIDKAEVVSAMIVGGITSRGNGTGKANASFLKSQKNIGESRIKKAFKNDGFCAGFSEIAPTIKYYLSQTSTIFYKPLINDAASTVVDDIHNSVGKALAKSMIITVY